MTYHSLDDIFEVTAVQLEELPLLLLGSSREDNAMFLCKRNHVCCVASGTLAAATFVISFALTNSQGASDQCGIVVPAIYPALVGLPRFPGDG